MVYILHRLGKFAMMQKHLKSFIENFNKTNKSDLTLELNYK